MLLSPSLLERAEWSLQISCFGFGVARGERRLVGQRLSLRCVRCGRSGFTCPPLVLPLGVSPPEGDGGSCWQPTGDALSGRQLPTCPIAWIVSPASRRMRAKCLVRVGAFRGLFCPATEFIVGGSQLHTTRVDGVQGQWHQFVRTPTPFEPGTAT